MRAGCAGLLLLLAANAVAGDDDVNEFCGQVIQLSSKVVRCHDPQLNEDGLSPLRIMLAIEELDLNETTIRDLRALPDLPKLTKLWLRKSRVQDLSPLKRFPGLQMLEISDTPVSDLTPLHDMGALEVLGIRNVQLAEDQIRALVEANPGVQLKGVPDDYTFLRPVNLSLTSEIGINGRGGHRMTNWLSLGFFGSKTARLHGLGVTVGHGMADEMAGAQLALLSNVVTREARGVQVSLIANKAGSGRGLQLAGVINRTTDEEGFEGLQLAGLVNWNKPEWREGTYLGIEVAGIANFGGRLQGLDVAGLVSWRMSEEMIGIQAAGALCGAKHVRGLQISGGIAGANKELWGLQVGGILAGGQQLFGVSVGGLGVVAGDEAVGIQAGGLATYARDGIGGLQLAGLMNFTGELWGLQVGASNFVEKDMLGAQIGAFNLATRVKGLQVGVVNMAEEVHGFSLGLFNWIDAGDIQLQLHADERAPFNLTAEYGNGRLHSLVTLGARPLGDKTLWHAGLGLGFRAIEGAFYLDADLIGGNVRYDFVRPGGRNLYGQLRVLGGYQIQNWLSVFGGVSMNVFMSTEGLSPELALAVPATDNEDEDLAVNWWLGVFGGVRFELKSPS